MLIFTISNWRRNRKCLFGRKWK